jgi:hypothetical protein
MPAWLMAMANKVAADAALSIKRSAPAILVYFSDYQDFSQGREIGNRGSLLFQLSIF